MPLCPCALVPPLPSVAATGEPALVLAVAVTLALHHAVLEARKEFGYVDESWLPIRELAYTYGRTDSRSNAPRPFPLSTFASLYVSCTRPLTSYNNVYRFHPVCRVHSNNLRMRSVCRKPLHPGNHTNGNISQDGIFQAQMMQLICIDK